MQPLATTGPWLPPTAGRPLGCWRDGHYHALAEAFDHVLAEWSRAWGISVRGVASCGPLAGVEPSSGWARLDMGAQCAGWLHPRPDTAPPLAAAVFGDCATFGPVAQQIAAASERDGMTRILAVVQLVPGPGVDAGPSLDDGRSWSGVVDVRLPDPLSCRLVLRPQAVAAWLDGCGEPLGVAAGATSTPLVGVLDAAAALSVPLDVQLTGCEMSLGTLQCLQPGDVVRLQHRISTPAVIRDATGTPFFDAFLGRRAGAKAVELGATCTGPKSQLVEGSEP